RHAPILAATGRNGKRRARPAATPRSYLQELPKSSWGGANLWFKTERRKACADASRHLHAAPSLGGCVAPTRALTRRWLKRQDASEDHDGQCGGHNPCSDRGPSSGNDRVSHY